MTTWAVTKNRKIHTLVGFHPRPGNRSVGKVGALRTLHRFLDGKFQSIAWGKRRAGPWKPQTGNYGRVVRIEQFFASREDGSERDSDHMAGITGLRGGLVVDMAARSSWVT